MDEIGLLGPGRLIFFFLLDIFISIFFYLFFDLLHEGRDWSLHLFFGIGGAECFRVGLSCIFISFGWRMLICFVLFGLNYFIWCHITAFVPFVIKNCATGSG